MRPILAGLYHHGADIAAALAMGDISPSVLDDPDARVPHESAVRMWRHAVQVTGDEALGLTATARQTAGSFGVPEYAFRKSATFGQAAERLVRYFRLHHDVARYAVRRTDETFEFAHRLPPGRTLPRAAVDFVLSAAVRLTRDATVDRLDPIRVEVDYPEPTDARPCVEAYGVRPRFGASERVLVYPASAADTPMREAEPALCAILDQHATHLLAALPRAEQFTERVRALLAEELQGGNPSAEHVADRLGMSVRTLQRYLADEGTSHKEILRTLRVDLAHSYLQDRGLGIGEVAFLLGFSEASAFHRAFRRWTGSTPAQFRQAA